ncbi:hypothetical protein A259_37686, partial [Pseudomonas syringae pv. actinidiae ICMP 19070]
MPRLTAQPAQLCVGYYLLGFLDGTAVALHIAQVERQGWRVDVAQLLAEIRFVLGFADAQTRLRH